MTSLVSDGPQRTSEPTPSSASQPAEVGPGRHLTVADVVAISREGRAVLRSAAAPAMLASRAVVDRVGSTPETASRLERMLTSEPGMGVLRDADAGYDRALEAAAAHGLRIRMGE